MNEVNETNEASSAAGCGCGPSCCGDETLVTTGSEVKIFAAEEETVVATGEPVPGVTLPSTPPPVAPAQVGSTSPVASACCAPATGAAACCS